MTIQSFIFPYDYILIIIFILILLFSFWKGFIQSLLGLLTWVGSIIITIYSYKNLSDFISKQLLMIDTFNNYESITSIIGIIISIPLLFLLSLFILKKIRKFLSNDLDKQILGILLDKFFGSIYWCIFNYLIFSTILYSLENVIFLESFYHWAIENSYILKNINIINTNIINSFGSNNI